MLGTDLVHLPFIVPAEYEQNVFTQNHRDFSVTYISREPFQQSTIWKEIFDTKELEKELK